MKWILYPSEIKQNHRNLVGGKAFALSIMAYAFKNIIVMKPPNDATTVPNHK